MTWSDAAREAAALARKNAAGTHGQEGPGKASDAERLKYLEREAKVRKLNPNAEATLKRLQGEAAHSAEQLFVKGKGHQWPNVTNQQLHEKGLTPGKFSQIARRGELNDAYSGKHSGLMLNGQPWVLKKK